MGFTALSHLLRVITLAVITDAHAEITVIVDAHRHLAGIRMLAHVGKGLLQNEQHLKLLVGVQWRTVPVIQVQLHIQPGLPAEAPDRVVHRLAQ